MSKYASYPSLEGKVALVTGGASGIGAAHVRLLSEQNCKVGFVDLNEEAAAALSDKLVADGLPRPTFIKADLRDVDPLKEAIHKFAATQGGTVHVLFNNAAHDQRHTVEEVTAEYFDERIAVNLRHLFFSAQAVLEGMKKAGGGSIVNFGSFSWRVGLSGIPIYMTAKAGIEGLTRALARDLGGHGIRVNCVIPGWIMTERQLELWVDEAVKARILEAQCLKKLVYPEDVSRMALWLAADDSGMCSAQTFVVDGGWS